MAWVRMEDTAADHPAVIAAGRGGDDRQVNEALGWLGRCAAWSGAHLTDGFVPEDLARQYAGSAGNYDRLHASVRRARQIVRARSHPVHGPGWRIASGDDAVLHIRTREEVEIDRARRGTTRQQDAKNDVRLRDGDQCRYCRAWVDFRLRKGKHRGTYDHVDPADRAVFVVCCGACNSRKGKRTPEQAGMVLLPPPSPDERHFSAETHDKLAALGLLPPRSGNQPDPAPTRAATSAGAATGAASSAPPRPADHAASGTTGSSPKAAGTPARRSASEPRSSTDALPRQHPPGRDGAGSGRDGTGAAARASPRGRRGRRGGRRSTTPT